MGAAGWLLCFWGAESWKSDRWIVKSVVIARSTKVCLFIVCVCVHSLLYFKGVVLDSAKGFRWRWWHGWACALQTLSICSQRPLRKMEESKDWVTMKTKRSGNKHNTRERIGKSLASPLCLPSTLSVSLCRFASQQLRQIRSAKKCYQTTLPLEKISFQTCIDLTFVLFFKITSTS